MPTNLPPPPQPLPEFRFIHSVESPLPQFPNTNPLYMARKQTSRALINGEMEEFSSVQAKFEALAKIWRRHVRGKSVINYAHYSYFQILTMGSEVIPFLLKEVAKGVGTWYVALQYITNETAETPEMRGDAAAVRDAWLRWGSRNGYSTEHIEAQGND